jgi:hypothetical protein
MFMDSWYYQQPIPYIRYWKPLQCIDSNTAYILLFLSMPFYHLSLPTALSSSSFFFEDGETSEVLYTYIYIYIYLYFALRFLRFKSGPVALSPCPISLSCYSYFAMEHFSNLSWSSICSVWSYCGQSSFVISWNLFTVDVLNKTILKTKLRGLNPRANYTDQATASFRRSYCQLLLIESPTWSAWRISMVVLSITRPEPLIFLPSIFLIVLTRLSGPRFRPTVSQKIW